jgi:hypothetical protein
LAFVDCSETVPLFSQIDNRSGNSERLAASFWLAAEKKLLFSRSNETKKTPAKASVFGSI